jgi:RNA polymerase sigma-70 factor (sigma-E family)
VSRETDSDFEEFFSARSPTLRRTAYVLCGDWSLAEELTQAALVKVYAQWHRLRRDGADAYARRVLINASASRWRKLRHERLVDSVPDSSAPVRSRDDHIVIAAALAELPTQQRAVIALRFIEDLSVEEVAGLLGIAEGTVKSHTSRATQALRAALAEPANHKENHDLPR